MKKFLNIEKKWRKNNEENDNIEEDNYQENENILKYKRKYKKMNKKEKYENKSNEYLKDRKIFKNNKKLKLKKEKSQLNKIDSKENIKYIFNNRNFIDDFIINKNLTNNLEYKRRYILKHIENINFKFNKNYIIFFYDIILNIILLFSQLIICNNRKIELASSYINLKIKGTGNINIYSESYRFKPDIVILIIKLTILKMK